MPGMERKGIRYITKSTVESLYESMMCPHLEEYILVLSPLQTMLQERKSNEDGQRYAATPMQVPTWVK